MNPSQIRVALTGTHGVGKTYILGRLTRSLTKAGYTVASASSFTRQSAVLGFKNNGKGDPRTEFMCGALRMKWEREVANDDNIQFVLGDRCLFDEFVYSQYLHGSEHPLTLLLQEMFQKQLEEGYWDGIYLKTKHPDYGPEVDGFREADTVFQSEIEDGFIKSIPGFAWGGVIGLTRRDRDAAYFEILESINMTLSEKGWNTVV